MDGAENEVPLRGDCTPNAKRGDIITVLFSEAYPIFPSLSTIQ